MEPAAPIVTSSISSVPSDEVVDSTPAADIWQAVITDASSQPGPAKPAHIFDEQQNQEFRADEAQKAQYQIGGTFLYIFLVF